jgi:hypothetical protein
VASLIRFIFAADDEVAFLRAIEGQGLQVYPVRVPPGWKPFTARPEAVAELPEEALYLAAVRVGPVQVDKVKRGPDKGAWRVDEVRSPVIYFERSRLNEDGELESGKLWAELDITPQTGRRDAAPELFRRTFQDVEAWFRRACRKSEPVGFWIGPHAARQFKEGLVLRDAEPRGSVVRPYR